MKILNANILLCISTFALLSCAPVKSNLSSQGQESSVLSDAGAGDPGILQILSAVRKQYNVPAMSAALLTDQGIQKVAAIGTRKSGTDVPVTLLDQWHLGSNTKIMTSTVIARLVEQGKLSWTSTVSDVFPDLADGFNPEVKNITILQLLSHTAGLPDNIEYDSIKATDSVRAQRIEAVKICLKEKPLSTPGTKYLYSNMGYIIAGAIIERALNIDWETAITQYVFTPLKMSSAGFGGLGTEGKIDQPWGHETADKPSSTNGPDADNPPVLGPAGRVHCTIQDWALFIADQLRGARGEPGLLKPESYKMLQSIHFDEFYGLGWMIITRSNKDIVNNKDQKKYLHLSGGTVLTHTGCNTKYFAMSWVAPAKNFAIIVCTNEGLASNDAVNMAVTKLIEFVKKH